MKIFERKNLPLILSLAAAACLVAGTLALVSAKKTPTAADRAKTAGPEAEKIELRKISAQEAWSKATAECRKTTEARIAAGSLAPGTAAGSEFERCRKLISDKISRDAGGQNLFGAPASPAAAKQ